MAQKNALQQALAAIGKAGNSLATQVSGKGKDLIKSKKAAVEQALKQFSRGIGKNPVPKNRVGRGARPIATMTNGSVLYDDGSTRRSKDTEYLNRIRDNVFRQYAFTPQAEKFLRSVPLGYTNDENAGGIFSNYGFLDAFGEGPGGILINKSNVNQDKFGPFAPGDTMAHEMLHAVDDNLSLNGDAGWLAPGQAYQNRGGNSRDFYEILTQNPGPQLSSINDFLKLYPPGYGGGQRADWKDTEGFAQQGAQLGQKTLLEPTGGAFQGVFQPMSKNINQSFAYPVSGAGRIKTSVPGNRIRNKILDPKKLQSISLEEDFI